MFLQPGSNVTLARNTAVSLGLVNGFKNELPTKYFAKASLKIGYDKQKYNKDRKAFYTLIQDIMPDVYEEVGERVRGEVLSSEELKEVYNNKNIAKCITFIYTDKGEYYNVKPIGDEAVKRGYSVKYTENIKEKAEIGIYCQHVCYPENSQFSMILLHYMAQGHNRWPNIWEIEESIMVALEMCDMVVSDESNVMAEALMFGKPSVAVTDWLIPDKNPPRCADVTMDYVIKCRKAELRETVENVMNNPDKYKSVMDNGKKLYSNQGNVCKDVMDLIDYYTQNGDSDSFMDKKITVDYSRCGLWI